MQNLMEPFGFEEMLKLHAALGRTIKADIAETAKRVEFAETRGSSYRAVWRELWRAHDERMEPVKREYVAVGNLIANYYNLQPVPEISVKEEEDAESDRDS